MVRVDGEGVMCERGCDAWNGKVNNQRLVVVRVGAWVCGRSFLLLLFSLLFSVLVFLFLFVFVQTEEVG